MKICAFTGHRNIPYNDIIPMPEKLGDIIEDLISKGYGEFRCGGAQGFDTIAALKVLEAKKDHPHVRLALFLPCKDQARAWSNGAKAIYERIISMADSVVYSAESYKTGCMHARNRAMINGADICVAYCKSSKGGTAYTVSYAKNHGIEIIMV